MLFTENLEEIIFHRHRSFQADELVVVSGYLGPKPVERLGSLPFPAKVVYGMYGSDGIKLPLHNSLVALQTRNKDVDIFYSRIPVHSKCYAWRKRGEIVHALLGSANFSTSGLTTPFREVLAETGYDAFDVLNNYINKVLIGSISCLEVHDAFYMPTTRREDKCLLSLVMRDGQTHNAGGLNWGQNPSNHTNRDDAYLPISAQVIRGFPNVFTPKQSYPSEEIQSAAEDGSSAPRKSHNDSVDLIWDDGVFMEGLFEGTHLVDGVEYPKQISSRPSKSEMGVYLRKRLGVPQGQPVRRHHLDSYGRTDVEISKIEDGVYRLDFSV